MVGDSRQTCLEFKEWSGNGAPQCIGIRKISCQIVRDNIIVFIYSAFLLWLLNFPDEKSVRLLG